MKDERIDDLKQFIAGLISRSSATLDEKLDGLKLDIDELRQEMNDGFAGVGEAIEDLSAHVDERLTVLEKRTAWAANY